MAAHDLRCTACGRVQYDVDIPIAQGARVYCLEHRCPEDDYFHEPGEWAPCHGRLEPIPAIGRMDVGGVKGASFQPFEVSRQLPTREGLQEHTETIDSVHKLRQVERDSEQRYRDGEGEPLRFRAWTQDSSNRDVGSFGREGRIGDRVYDSGQTPQKKPNISIRRHGERNPISPWGLGCKRRV